MSAGASAECIDINERIHPNVLASATGTFEIIGVVFTKCENGVAHDCGLFEQILALRFVSLKKTSEERGVS